MFKHKALSLLSAAALLTLAVGCAKKEEAPAPAPPAAETPAPPPAEGKMGTATVSGKIMLTGEAPKAVKVDTAADPKCAEKHKDAPLMSEKVVVGPEGALANVFVYVKEGVSGTYPVPTEPAVIDQVGCQYVPHVSGVRVNQTVLIKNSDGTLHNVHSLAANNDQFNVAMPASVTQIEQVFTAPEIMVPVKCEVHNWMNAWIGVVEHPFFAVSAADGTFSVANLPAGTYTVEAVHEVFGRQTAQVTVADGETKDQGFTFDAAAAAAQ